MKNELKKLRRIDLLEMLLELRRENDFLRTRVTELEDSLKSKTIQINNSGSIAEASLMLNGVFEAAQAACDQYKQNVRMQCDMMEQETKNKCEAMLLNAKSRIE